MLRQTTNAPFVAGATAARPLGARSGVRPGTSTGSVTATSTAWSVAPLSGVIDGEAANEAGPYTFSSDATVTGSVTAANASNPRIDLIYVQVSDPAESDGSTTPGVSIGYLAGTAAATPTVPTTPARSFVLAQINVPKSGAGSPSVTWVAPFMAAAGGTVWFNTVAELTPAAAVLPLWSEAIIIGTGAKYVLGTPDGGTTRTWAQRGTSSFATGMDNTGGGTVAAGTMSSTFGSRSVTMPAAGDIHVFAQVYVYVNTTNTVAGSIFIFIDGVQQSADGVRGRIQPHNRTGWSQVMVDAHFPAAPGSHTVAIRVGADPNTATFEIQEVQFNYSLTY
jgi:hypothetical protein